MHHCAIFEHDGQARFIQLDAAWNVHLAFDDQITILYEDSAFTRLSARD